MVKLQSETSVVTKYILEVFYLGIYILCYFKQLLHNISEANLVLFTPVLV